MCAQSCLSLCNPMDYNPPGSSVHGVLQSRILEWVAIPSSTIEGHLTQIVPLGKALFRVMIRAYLLVS